MQKPGSERYAVAQTPYSAIPDAPSVLERVAGATTDIQYIIHQGVTHYSATYWVGANALLRKAALDDICVLEQERGHQVTRYIQDRTVIEDTESTVDLLVKGWQLYNYPERMVYSATPPDFGSLLIQRRRWANGGLIILLKLLHYLWTGPWTWARMMEGLVRFHYLASIGPVSLAVLLLIVIPFGDELQSFWLPLMALPYYFLYGRDLIQIGYKPADLMRVYAFNLLLIPINIAGALKSLQQGWTGQKIPFGRTPKILDRTAAPASFLLMEYALLLLCIGHVAGDLIMAHWTHAIFPFFNAVLMLYGILRFIGLRESGQDLVSQVIVLQSFSQARLSSSRQD